jgi:aryl-alcohol dehydrogenase-like predicted oxidoreductase
LAYCHRPSHVRAALACEQITGIAAQFNAHSRWAEGLLPEIAAAGRQFIGMSPLARGTLVDRGAPTPAERLWALQWAAAVPRVDAITVTISSISHLRELLNVLDDSPQGECDAPIQSGHPRETSLGAPQ